MIIRFKKYSKTLYIFFLFLSLVLFFFSTDKVKAKSFSIDNIEIFFAFSDFVLKKYYVSFSLPVCCKTENGNL